MNDLEMIIYLWSRDAGMTVDDYTEYYLRHQLKLLYTDTEISYSDIKRLEMAKRLATICECGES